MSNNEQNHFNHHHNHSTHDNTQKQERVFPLALSATLHCLLGCGLGEVLGMVIAVWFGLSMTSSMVLAMILRFIFGLALGVLPLVRKKFTFRKALKAVILAEGLSIVIMEVFEVGTQILIPGIAALPVKVVKIRRGVRHTGQPHQNINKSAKY